MVTKLDYNEQMVQAAHAVLLEIVHILGEYREGIVLVGGVPGLLLPENANEHVGSMDVDIALDQKLLEETGYAPIAGSATVGSYPVNQWGLYDMHGNVWEWCLDWSGTYPGTVMDPKVAESGSYRVGRGGSWDDGAYPASGSTSKTILPIIVFSEVKVEI